MTKLRIILLGLLLVLTSARVDAALFGGEKKAFEAASKSFQLKLWERAEKEFAEFIKDHPKSEKIAEALLLQAQAEFEQQKYAALVGLLEPRVSEAGALADQFWYWIAASHFAGTNYSAAAVAFGKLAREFPDSPRRLEAAVNEAAALGKLGQWSNAAELLRRADGAFRQASLSAKGSEMVARGFLLLAEAQLAQKKFPDAKAALDKVGEGLSPELDYQRRNLLCRTLAESGRTEEAARESLGLIKAAEGVKPWELLSDSVVFRAELLEQLGRWDEAIAAWQMNFTNAPVARQRQALAKGAALAIQHDQLTNAVGMLESYLNASTNAPAADVAWLTLGELHLKQQVGLFATNAANDFGINHLAVATNCFQRVLKGFPGSAYVGRAQLNLGWCYWVENRFAESEAAFEVAVKRLPQSEDRAVAQFKLADAQFAQTNYPAALANYREVLHVVTNWPAVNGALRTPASYQALRASLELTNAAGAEQAMREILKDDSASEEAIGSVLLVAQAYVDANQPVEAQRLFGEFALQFPQSELRPEVELLMARLREEQGDWMKAAAAYDAWLGRYGTNRLRAQVEFQRALAAAGMGEETNALQRFTNFVAQYPTQELAPQAQWWVADWYYQQGNFQEAEISYKQLLNNWPKSGLAYEARMMAGRAALAWSKYENAIEHFTTLTIDTNCPPGLWMQAMSAYGGALLRAPAKGTNKLENMEEALRVYKKLVQELGQKYPTNAFLAAAWGELGNGAVQLSDFVTASNAYQQAMTFPTASVAVRSQARVGLAIVLEKQAAVAGAGASDLNRQAREFYMDVYMGKLGKFLREGEGPDVFWTKKAGMEAARLSESLNEWPQALLLYQDMLREKLLPPEKLAAKISNAEKQVRAAGKND